MERSLLGTGVGMPVIINDGCFWVIDVAHGGTGLNMGCTFLSQDRSCKMGVSQEFPGSFLGLFFDDESPSKQPPKTPKTETETETVEPTHTQSHIYVSRPGP